MRVLFTADLHLSPTIWKQKKIFGDSYFAWSLVVKAAIESECQAVVLAGDVLDKQVNNAETAVRLKRGLDQLNKAGIVVYYIQGQHEFQDTPWISLDSEAIWLDKLEEPVDLGGGFMMSGFDFGDQEKLIENLNSEKTASSNVLVCHQVWDNLMGIGDCQASFDDIPEHVLLTVTGDYHVTKRVDSPRLVLSPGSTHMRSIDEPEDKFVYLVDFHDTDHEIEICKLPIASRRKITLDLGDYSGVSDAYSALKHHLSLSKSYAKEFSLPPVVARPVVRLTYDQLTHEIAKSLIEDPQLSDLVFWLPNYRPGKEGEISVSPEKQGSLVDCLPEYLDPEVNKRSFSLAKRLLGVLEGHGQQLEVWFESEKKDLSEK